MNNLNLPIIYVEWIDSWSSYGWQSSKSQPNVEDESCNCLTIGWLISESDDNIRIAQNLGDISSNESLDYNSIITIPKVAIRKYYEIVFE